MWISFRVTIKDSPKFWSLKFVLFDDRGDGFKIDAIFMVVRVASFDFGLNYLLEGHYFATIM